MPTITGTSGPDRFTPSGENAFTMVGQGGNDRYVMRLFQDTIFPAFGASYVVYLRDAVVEDRGGGRDTVTLRASYNPVGFTGVYPVAAVGPGELADVEVINVTYNPDIDWVITAGRSANLIRAVRSDDVIDGGGGNDVVYGGGGGDKVSGNDGNDRVFGDAGDDALFGNDGRDQLSGGSGNDVLSGGRGADRLLGGSGIDEASYAAARGGVRVTLGAGSGGPKEPTGNGAAMQDAGADAAAAPMRGANTGDAAGDSFASIENLGGSASRDVLIGNAGANAIRGGAGNDVLGGGPGNDTLDGGRGTDRLDGGAGNDLLFVAWNEAADDLIGGAGLDVFRFALADDVSTARLLGRIDDFGHGDRINLDIEGTDSVVAFVRQTGADVEITLRNVVSLRGSGIYGDTRGTLLLHDVDAGTLTMSDFSGRVADVDAALTL